MDTRDMQRWRSDSKLCLFAYFVTYEVDRGINIPSLALVSSESELSPLELESHFKSASSCGCSHRLRPSRQGCRQGSGLRTDR